MTRDKFSAGIAAVIVVTAVLATTAMPADYELKRIRLVPVNFTPDFAEDPSAAAQRLAFLANPHRPASPSQRSGPMSWCSFILTGPIEGATPKQAEAQLDKALYDGNCDELSIVLNSPGGDVEAAIALGRYLRLNHLHTSVRANTNCSSACVLLFVGGVYRSVEGVLGVHRPYAPGISPSYAESQRQFSKIRALVEDYLREMNLPSSAADLILTVPAAESRSITSAEAERLGFAGMDAAYQDHVDSSWASYYGITKTDYYLRRRAALALCGKERNDEAANNCFTRMLRYGQ